MLDILIRKKDHPGKIKKDDKRLASNLNYEGIVFPVKEKYFEKIEVQNNTCVNVFGYEDKLVFPNTFLIKILTIQYICYFCLKIINRIMCTLKTLTHLCFTKQKIKIKKGFVKAVYNVLVMKRYW